MARCIWRGVILAAIGMAGFLGSPALSLRAEDAGQAEEGEVAAAEAQPVRTLRLWIDGNLPGRVVQRGNGGLEFPAQATISFRQDGEVLYQTRSDERGFFQVVGVEPGIYAVTATGPAGSAALMVEVLPYDAELFEDQRLDILLDSAAVPGEGPVAPPTAPPPPLMMMPAAAGGGGGGGLSALGVAAGIAGLAVGVVALATSDEAEPLPSPFIP